MNTPKLKELSLFYSVRDYAAKAGVSLTKVYRDIAAGIIPATADLPRRVPRAWADKHLSTLIAEAIDAVTVDSVADERDVRRGRVR